MIKFRYLHWEISVKILHNGKEMILYIKSQYLYAAFPILYVHRHKHTHMSMYINVMYIYVHMYVTTCVYIYA